MTKVSYKDMKITYHGRFRMSSRREITTQDDRRRIAYKARYEGVKIEGADCRKNNWGLNVRSDRLYKFFDGNIFVFAGKGRRTLITVIPVDVKEEVRDEKKCC